MTGPDAAHLFDDAQHLHLDLPCTGCHYNLRTLHIDARCPECDRPVRDSITPRPLHFSSPAWLRTVSTGMLLMLIAMPTLILMRTAALAVNEIVAPTRLTRFWQEARVPFVVCQMTLWLVLLTGAWLMVEPETDAKNRPVIRGSQVTVRWCALAVLFFNTFYILAIVEGGWHGELRWLGMCGSMNMVLATIGAITLALYLESFTPRLNRPTLRQPSILIAVACIGIQLLVLFDSSIIHLVSRTKSLPPWLGSHETWSWMVTLCVFAVGIWAFILLLKYRRAFQHARMLAIDHHKVGDA